MTLDEIERDLDGLRNACVQLLNGITELQVRIQEEIHQRDSVEFILIPKRKRMAGASMYQKVANPFEGRVERFRQHRSVKYDSLGVPTLHDRMEECGYTRADIKKLFGENSHIMAKIAYGRQRFRDYEAQKLTELFHLTEEEQHKYFWAGLIRTKQHPVG